MRSTLNNTTVFLTLQLLFLGAGLLPLIMVDKHDLHLWLNQWHSPFGDIFFKYATHLAEGFVIGSAVFLVLIYKVRFGIAGLIGVIGSGLITQFLKRMVFNDHFRPSKVFEGLADLHFVDGVSLHKAFSFPSGHSTAAFALFFFIAIVTKKTRWQVLCFAFAMLTAYSRVYLSQHFFEDIYVGSMVGTTFCLLVFALFRDQRWGNKGLLSYFDR